MNNLAQYLAIREEMKTGDMLAWASNSLIGRIIRWRSGPYSHTSGIIRLTEYEGLPKRRFTLEAMKYGFYPAILSNDLKNYAGRVWWYALKDEWNPKRQAIGEKALSLIGIGYDYKSLFRNALGRVNSDARKLFCSEAWFLIYGFAGKAPTPSDMPKLGIFKDPVQIL
jgi:hypothetical protein